MANQPVVPPGGEFPVPSTSDQPLLAFRCAPAIKPYLAEDTTGSIIIDTIITNTAISGAGPIQSAAIHSSAVFVSIYINGHVLASGTVPLNATGHELEFSLESLKPQKAAFDVTCSALAPDGQMFRTNTTVQRMPDNADGSVTKMDLRSGAMLVKDAQGKWDSVFPIGFYTVLSSHLSELVAWSQISRSRISEDILQII